MMKTHQRGFTLIELVVVIVILGILAAFAVPRFMGMEGEARASTVKSFGGSLRSAAALARGKCQAQDCATAAVPNTVTVDGTVVTMQFGYPNAASIAATMDLATAGFQPAVAQGANGMRFRKTGGGANCWVQYNAAANANSAPTITYAWNVAAANFNQQLAAACGG